MDLGPKDNLELIEYCRRNLASHSPEDIHSGLLAEGLDEAEVNEALALALQAPPRQASKSPSLLSGLAWFVFFSSVIALLMAVIWHYSSLENKPVELPKDSSAGSEPAPEAGPSASAYSGHFGYLLRLPPGAAAGEGLCDRERQIETVLVRPADAASDKGTILLQANPRADPQRGLRDLSYLKSWYAQQGKKSRPAFSVEDVRGLPLPAFRLRYAASGSRADTFLEGRKVFYHFSSLKPGKDYAAVLAGLSEPDPKDRMQGFVLIKEDARAGKTYWNEDAQASVLVPPGYSRAQPGAGRGIRYDFAFKHDSDAFEARIRFDPTADASREYARKTQQPCFRQGTCPAQDPDAPTDAWASAVAMNMTDSPFSFDLVPDRLAREDFGADWGALSPTFELSPAKPFNYPYKVGVFLQLHKNGLGNCYVIFLGQAPDVLLRHTNNVAVSYSVKFTPAP